MIELNKALPLLHSHNIEFAIIGGAAARVHGSLLPSDDLDVVYARSDANIARLAKALSALNPYPRGAPPKLPFEWSARTIKSGLNFPLQTTIGDMDLLGEVIGGGRFEDLVGHCVTEKLFGHSTHVVSLPWLIRLKRAAGRVRDFEGIAELELLQDLSARAD